jgi:hypothetical protein
MLVRSACSARQCRGALGGASIVESKYSIEAGDGLVRLQVWGELRAQGLMALIAQIADDPRHRARTAVVDLREAYGNWDYSEIQLFRDHVARMASAEELTIPARWAAVVNPGTLVSAARVLIVISEPSAQRIRLRLFEDIQAALNWARKTPRTRPLESVLQSTST